VRDDTAMTATSGRMRSSRSPALGQAVDRSFESTFEEMQRGDKRSHSQLLFVRARSVYSAMTIEEAQDRIKKI
jgi:hypothetical protein